MATLIIISVLVLGGLLYLGYAIKNAPVIEEPEDNKGE